MSVRLWKRSGLLRDVRGALNNLLAIVVVVGGGGGSGGGVNRLAFS